MGAKRNRDKKHQNNSQSVMDAEVLQPVTDGETSPSVTEGKPSRKSKRSLRHKKRSPLLNYAILLASLIVILSGIHAARGILAPIFMATFLAVLLLPPLQWLRNKGLSELTSLLIVILTVLVGGTIVTTMIGSQLTQFAKKLPDYRDQFDLKLKNYDLNLGDFIPFLKPGSEEKPSPEAEQVLPDNVTPPNTTSSLESRSLGRRGATGTRRIGTFSQPDPVPEIQKIPPDTLPNKTTRIESVQPVQEDNIKLASHSDTGTASAPLRPGVLKESPVRSDNSTVVLQTSTDAPKGKAGEVVHLADRRTDDSSVSQMAASGSEDSSYYSGTMGNMGGTSHLSGENVTGELASTLLSNSGQRMPVSGASPGGALVDTADEMQNSQVNMRALTGAEDPMTVSSQELFKFIAGLTGELSVIASSAFIIMLLVIFMLLETTVLPVKIEYALGRGNKFKNGDDDTSDKRKKNQRVDGVLKDIRNYMIIKTFVSIIVGLLVLVLLLVTNVQYPFLWAFVAFLLNFIPNIGSVVAAVPPIILGTTDHGLLIGAILVGFFVLINCGVGYILEPKLLGNGLDLAPLVVLISLIFCGWLLGAIGMFLSPPLAVIIKIILQSFPETRWIAALMANGIPKEEKEKPKEESVAA